MNHAPDPLHSRRDALVAFGAGMLGLVPALEFAAEQTHAAPPSPPAPSPAWRGVFFNPQVAAEANFPWLLHYDAHRATVRTALSELRADVEINLVDVHIMIPHSLRVPARGNRVGEPREQWANLGFLDNIARFVDDCHAAGIDTELDLVDNRWIPATIDPDGHIGRPGNPWWPVADQTPWDEVAPWYAQVKMHGVRFCRLVDVGLPGHADVEDRAANAGWPVEGIADPRNRPSATDRQAAGGSVTSILFQHRGINASRGMNRLVQGLERSAGSPGLPRVTMEADGNLRCVVPELDAHEVVLFQQ